MAGEVHEVVIVGAGIAGLATAIALKKVGIQSIVLERSHELRATGAAITLYPNAWRALNVLGIASKLTSIYKTFERYFTLNLKL
ncbi:putative FAD-binding domain, FAD/NAD(P)-binding domain superfamily [Dioscorea sansibarensis]